MMADCVCMQVLTFCVFAEILRLCAAQNTHMQNVAKDKPCGTSSLYSRSNTCSAAINGNTNTYYSENPPNCINTAVYDTSPFWGVNLGEEVTISMITIYGRTNSIPRMQCVNVSVDGAFIKRFTDQNGWTNDKYNITVLRGGRVVNITRDCDILGPTINICEVQVWVCDNGWYEDCTKSCGQCNNNMTCDKVNGNCSSCKTGFHPPLCQECADGWYGTDCSQTCGNCGSNSVCDKTTGRCTSCTTGYSLPLCTECAYGWYGADCSQTCGNCGSTSECNKVTGRCTSCKTGFSQPYCKDCENGWYGDNCVETCGHCVGGNSTCDKINGSCPFCGGAFQPPLCKDNLSSKLLTTTLNTSSSVQATVTEYPSFSSTGGISSDNDKETVSVAGPVAGAAIGCAVVFFIIGAVFGWWLRKSRSQQPSARGPSPYEISTMSEAETSRSTSRSDEKVDVSTDYSNLGYSTNVYDALKGPDDDNTTAYTSLGFHTNDHS